MGGREESVALRALRCCHLHIRRGEKSDRAEGQIIAGEDPVDQVRCELFRSIGVPFDQWPFMATFHAGFEPDLAIQYTLKILGSKLGTKLGTKMGTI